MLINTIPRDSAPNATAKDNEFGNLPEWDLSDLYTAPDSPALQKDLNWLTNRMCRVPTRFRHQTTHAHRRTMARLYRPL